MFVMVVYFFLLAGLLFLVMNTGDLLNRKVLMQGAADSTACSGADWYARGLNTIAFCNVTDTQLLSLIVLLDTLETVVPPATECVDDLMSNIGSSAAGHDIPIDDRTCKWLAVGNAASEREIIRRFWDIVQGIPMDEYLTYDEGVVWECVKLLDGFGHAMIDVTPLASQREAMDIARKNHAEFGFVLPLWPELPVYDGQFSDFRNPMEKGRLPPPYENQAAGGYSVMGYYGYGGNRMGPWAYWREPFTHTQPMGLLDISRFSVLFNVVSYAKLEMLFGSGDDRVSLRRWEMDYEKAKSLDPDQVRRAWWERIHFDSRYPFPQSSFFSNMQLREPQEPRVRMRTFPDMENPDLTGWTRAKESYEGADPRLAVWYKVDERRTAHYPQIGIFAPHPPMNPDGSPWPYTEAEKQTYYSVSFWRFDGAELEDDTTLHRRYMAAAGTTPPFAPILPTREVMDNKNYATVLKWFTFNSFAYRPGAVSEWADRFVNPNPIPKTLAFAEARVYNYRGWDMFTQYWQVKLHRQEKWDELAAELGRGLPPQASSISGAFTPERLQPVADLLGSYDAAFVEKVAH